MWLLLLTFASISTNLVISASGLQKQVYRIEHAEYHFQEFISTFNKTYSTQVERDMRFLIFKDNLQLINKHNEESDAFYGITMFADMTMIERKEKYTGYIPRSISHCKVITDDVTWRSGSAPESLDWREKGVVTSVKSQGDCGACWAFSTVGNLEGQYAIKYNNLQEFSVQQLLDCDGYDSGCEGGEIGTGILWLKENGGIMNEADYRPYAETQQSCLFDPRMAAATVTDCVQYHTRNEDELKQILAEVGPLLIAVDSTMFGFYPGGIMDCRNHSAVDHAVLLVGYGKEGNQPYWIVKNSFGTQWGEDGYVRLEMYKNSCNMLYKIVSAVVQ